MPYMPPRPPLGIGAERPGTEPGPVAGWWNRSLKPGQEALSVGGPMPLMPALAGAAGALSSPKAAEREARASHATATAEAARTDPASGTQQGAAQPYRGTGNVKSPTASTGGVTIGAPGVDAGAVVTPYSMIDVQAPGLREAFAERPFLSGGGPAAPQTPGQVRGRRGGDFEEHGPKSAMGGHTWTKSSVPEGAQIENWDAFLKAQAAGEQGFRTEMASARAAEAGSEAQTARSERLAEEPFYVEELGAQARLGEAQVKAATDVAKREDVKRIVSQASERINQLQMDPRFRSLAPAEQKRMTDQIWDEARLALSGLAETNLYPRPDPYAFMGMAPTPPPAKE